MSGLEEVLLEWVPRIAQMLEEGKRVEIIPVRDGVRIYRIRRDEVKITQDGPEIE